MLTGGVYLICKNGFKPRPSIFVCTRWTKCRVRGATGSDRSTFGLLINALCFIYTSALRCSGLCTHQLFLQQQSGHEYSSDKPCRCYLPVKQTRLATSLWTLLDRAGYFPETRTNLKCWATFCTFESQVVPLIPLIVLPNTQQNVMHNI